MSKIVGTTDQARIGSTLVEQVRAMYRLQEKIEDSLKRQVERLAAGTTWMPSTVLSSDPGEYEGVVVTVLALTRVLNTMGVPPEKIAKMLQKYDRSIEVLSAAQAVLWEIKKEDEI